MSVATELHHHESTGEQGEPKRPPILTLIGWILFGFAGLATVIWAFWTVGDLMYRDHLETPAGWWVLLIVAVAAWVAFVVRCGQESMIRRLDRVLEFIALMHHYHADLGDRLDRYGDAREINGHHLAAEAIRGNGHARHLHLAD